MRLQNAHESWVISARGTPNKQIIGLRASVFEALQFSKKIVVGLKGKSNIQNNVVFYFCLFLHLLFCYKLLTETRNFYNCTTKHQIQWSIYILDVYNTGTLTNIYIFFINAILPHDCICVCFLGNVAAPSTVNSWPTWRNIGQNIDYASKTLILQRTSVAPCKIKHTLAHAHTHTHIHTHVLHYEGQKHFLLHDHTWSPP